MADLSAPIARVARHFILVRQIRMRGVDLARFDFDFDLTWMGFFLDDQGGVLGRYGSRTAESPDNRQSLAGLRYAMTRALEQFRAGTRAPTAPAQKPDRIDDHDGARRLPATACIHCHQVHEIRRDTLQQRGTWSREQLWIYPWPENLGLALDMDQGDRIAAVREHSPAARLGLRAGDTILTVEGQRVASIADVQYLLHRAPSRGTLSLQWQRMGRIHAGKLSLDEGWRKTDLSWRWSLRSLDPAPQVSGDDLSVERKRALGLDPASLAFEQDSYLSPTARHAGIRAGDVILGVDGKRLSLSARQFATHVRLTYRVGDRVIYNLLRDGKRIDIPLTLPGRR